MEQQATPGTRPDLSSAMVNAVLEWDVHNWSRALRFWHREISDLHGRQGLEIGARRGGLSLYMAWRGARVVCSDLAPPGEAARALHRKFAVEDRIQYVAADATSLPFDDDSLDLVMAKSVLGSISADGHPERQSAAIAEIHRVLRPGGRLYIAENLAATSVHRFLRRRFVPWGQRWCYLAYAELGELLAAFAEVELHSCGFLGLVGRSETQRRVLGHLDDCLTLLPAGAHYLGYGHGTKLRITSEEVQVAKYKWRSTSDEIRVTKYE